MANWWRIGLLISLGYMAVGVGVSVCSYFTDNPGGTLAGPFFFVLGALTLGALRFRWLTLFAVPAHAFWGGLSAMWIPGLALCVLLDAQHRGFFALPLACFVAYAGTAALSILALLKREERHS